MADGQRALKQDQSEGVFGLRKGARMERWKRPKNTARGGLERRSFGRGVKMTRNIDAASVTQRPRRVAKASPTNPKKNLFTRSCREPLRNPSQPCRFRRESGCQKRRESGCQTTPNMRPPMDVVFAAAASCYPSMRPDDRTPAPAREVPATGKQTAFSRAWRRCVQTAMVTL